MPECPRAQLGVALDRPEPGHFAIRLRRRGEWVPALIYLPCPFIEPDPFSDYPRPEDWFESIGKPAGPLRARVGEREVEGTEMVVKVWQGARGVSLAEYRYLEARRVWARRHDPDSYHARRADLRVLKNRELLG